ncbi:cupin domain-containing protein [Streptomyces antnestii]|uniref:Cupin domain-containing protein n=1 Tax=Streptomyces antnestii TaxID=2494256 RepID=A0A437PLN3_9ACTN|nr:cupin domain-containing protein [Streptomyces sp. San01]RVU23206.1 cupin domain-containing protein [Streptomyces sp. San01]
MPLEPRQELGADLLIDEDQVKCWVETVPPGEQRPAHTHRHPWVTVVLSGAHGESLDENGELIKTVTLETGQVGAQPRRVPAHAALRHYVRNLSDQTFVMVAIELRTPTAPEEGPSS